MGPRSPDGLPARDPRDDEGEPIPESKNIAGCYAPWSRTIYLFAWAPECTLRHELCHAAGYPRDLCERSARCD